MKLSRFMIVLKGIISLMSTETTHFPPVIIFHFAIREAATKTPHIYQKCLTMHPKTD